MGYNTGIITAPVSIYDVQRALVNSSSDLGTLIHNGNINMWARFKPVRYPSVGLITDAQRASVNHGISIPTPVIDANGNVTAQHVIDAAGRYEQWAYLKPTGGASQPFRLADFANTISQGYYHAAQPPIQLNYPRGGWTFIKGGTSKALVMSFDLDPSDSAVNLQSYDFMGSLDLRQYKLITYVDGIGLFEADDFILDSEGEVSGSTIAVMIPSTTGSYSREAYVCMYRTNGNTKEFLPIMASDGYTPDNLTIYIKDDAEASGGGIPGADTQEMFENIEFSPTLNGTYRNAWVTTDGGTGQWCMVSQGSLYVKMTLKNTKSSAATFQTGNFQLDLNDLGPRSASDMYNSSKMHITSVTVPSGGTVTIYLFYNAIFTELGSDWTTSNKNSSWSMDFTRNSGTAVTLLGCDIYAMSGTDGWVER